MAIIAKNNNTKSENRNNKIFSIGNGVSSSMTTTTAAISINFIYFLINCYLFYPPIN